METILIKTDDSAISVEQGLEIFNLNKFGTILHQFKNNALVDMEIKDVPKLKELLIDWIVSPQSNNKAQIPDARIRIKEMI